MGLLLYMKSYSECLLASSPLCCWVLSKETGPLLCVTAFWAPASMKQLAGVEGVNYIRKVLHASRTTRAAKK